MPDIVDTAINAGSFNTLVTAVTVGLVNDATVVTPDVEADNGVIHVIDTVLIPA